MNLRWTRPAFWATLLLAAVLYLWNLGANGDANTYYSAAVYSGTQSWKAFFFGSLDAGSFITVDKPPFALWVMGLSARIFGYNTWSILLPQVLAGVASVAILYSAVRRGFTERLGEKGAAIAATLAALVLALTPITVAINRDNNPDTVLVLLLVGAAWCLQEALRGRLLPLLGSAVLVGCAFNTKMLQAYVVLPAFTLVYLACANIGLGKRIRNLLLAGVALLASSGWWMAVVALVPAANRPYIGGSTDNTVWDLVIGYNGLGRIFGSEGPGGGRAGGGFGGESGIGRMFNTIIAGQISWLLPAALVALIAGVLLVGRARRADLARASLLLWGGWLAVHFVVFSFASGTFHPYYTTAMAPAVGALAGAGAVFLWQAPRRWSWLLPLTVALTGGWAFALLRRTPDWQPWLAWTVAGAAVLAVLALLLARRGKAIAVSAVALSLVATLAGPAAFAVSAAGSRVNGTNPTAGPSTGGGGFPGGGGMAPRDGVAAGQMPRGMQPPSGGGMQRGPGGQVSDALVSYLVKNQGSAEWLVAVSSAMSAAPLILKSGRPVISMGGFSGNDKSMTVEKLQDYVKSGRLKYILVGGDRNGTGEVAAWAAENGTPVDLGDTSGGTLYRLG